jgi:hypothetical protein
MVKSAPDSVAAFLRPAARGDKSGELLVIPGWRQADWEALFSYAQRVLCPARARRPRTRPN